MTRDPHLFVDPPNATPDDDADLALITAYLARELPLEDMLAVEDRLATDAAFRAAMQPVLDAWALPLVSGVALVDGGELLPAPALAAGWWRHVEERRAPASALRRTRWRGAQRAAAIVAAITLPIIAVAQAAAYFRRPDSTPQRPLVTTRDERPSVTLNGPVVPAAPRASSVAPARDSTGGTTAQALRRVVLTPPTEKLRAEFSVISSVRELSDGRVVVTDFKEKKLAVTDWTKHTVTAFGRFGSGPGEYLHVIPLTAIAGDSTLMIDATVRRYTVIDPALRMSTLPPDHPLVQLVGTRIAEYSDTHVLMTQSGPAPRAPQRLTGALVLYARASLRGDTIARVDRGIQITLADIDRTKYSDGGVAYPIWDQYALARDGWVVVARHDPYRVEWRSPSGQWTIGPTVTEPRIKTAGREKDAMLARVSNRPGWVYLFWPEFVPPFSGRGDLHVTPNGEVMIERTPTVDRPSRRFDVFDRRGVRLYELEVPKNLDIIGFGKSQIYITVTDDVGLQTLGRQPWPLAAAR